MIKINYPPGEELRSFRFIAARIDKVTYLYITAPDELRAYERGRKQVEEGISEENWVDPPEDLKMVFIQYENEIDLGEI